MNMNLTSYTIKEAAVIMVYIFFENEIIFYEQQATIIID